MRTAVAVVFTLILCSLAPAAEARTEKLVHVRLRSHETILHMMQRKHIHRGFYREILVYNDINPGDARKFRAGRRGFRMGFPTSFLHAKPTKREIRRSARLLERQEKMVAQEQAPSWVAERSAANITHENIDISALPSSAIPQAETRRSEPFVPDEKITVVSLAVTPANKEEPRANLWMFAFFGMTFIAAGSLFLHFTPLPRTLRTHM